MRRLLFLILVLIHSVCFSADELVILTWEDYIAPDVVQDFQKETGIKLKFVYFEEDDERDEIMASTNGAGYDVVCIDDAFVSTYRDHNWISKLDYSLLPNLKQIEYPWLSTYKSEKFYAVPYLWGTVGIAYNKSKVDQPTSWMDIFRPAEKLKGRILMQNTAQVLYGQALKALGYSINSQNPKEMREAEDLLWEQKKSSPVYGSLLLDENSQLLTDEVDMAMAYNGDALMLMEENENIAFMVPKEGTSIWIDFFAITSGSPKKIQAHQFLDFINRPQMAASNADYASGASPNKGARQILGDEYLKNPLIFPTANTIKHSELFEKLPSKVMKRISSTYIGVTSGQH